MWHVWLGVRLSAAVSITSLSLSLPSDAAPAAGAVGDGQSLPGGGLGRRSEGSARRRLPVGPARRRARLLRSARGGTGQRGGEGGEGGTRGGVPDGPVEERLMECREW